MKLLIMSDLHLEWKGGPPVCTFIDKDKEDTIVILAGDVANNVSGVWYAEEHLCPYVKAVIYVPGNHEYYGYDFTEVDNSIQREIENRGIPNLYHLNMDVIVIDDIKFIGATLWTDLDRENPSIVKVAGLYMNDYHAIQSPLNYVSLYSGGGTMTNRLTPQTTINTHYRHREFIMEQVEADPELKKVVVTHHLPSYQLIAPWFRDPKRCDDITLALNHAYAVDLDHCLSDNNIDLWVHGHSHIAHEKIIGNTRVISNARGYPGQYVRGFNPDLRIEI